MSTKNLISQLFKENQFSSRSSSLFQSTFHSHENPLKKPPPNPISTNPKPPSNPTMNKYLHLSKMVHMLALKIRKLNYFFFVKLQENGKKYGSLKQNENFKQLVAQFMAMSQSQREPQPTHRQQDREQQSETNNKQKQKRAIEILLQVVSVNECKYYNNSTMELAFLSLKKLNNKYIAAEQIGAHLEKARSRNHQFIFNVIYQHEKYVLKSNIFVDTVVQILMAKLKEVFWWIKKQGMRKEQSHRQLKHNQAMDSSKFSEISEFFIPVSTPLTTEMDSESDKLPCTLRLMTLGENLNSKFGTPQKSDNHSSERYEQTQKINLCESKILDKDSRNLLFSKQLNGKKNKKFLSEQQCQSGNFYRSNRYHLNEEQIPVYFKPITRIQPHQLKIFVGKTSRIKTQLVDNNTIKYLQKENNNQCCQCMVKYNRLYSQEIVYPLPDLHDNIGVFENVLDDEKVIFTEENISWRKSVHYLEKQDNEIVKQKISHFLKKEKQNEQFGQYNKVSQKQSNDPTPANPIIPKCSTDSDNQLVRSQTTTALLRNAVRCDKKTNNNNPTMNETLIKDNGQERNRDELLYQGVLAKIEKMIKGIGKPKPKEKKKINGKNVSGSDKNKIPTQLLTARNSTLYSNSYQNSANKIQYNTVHLNTLFESKPAKKEPLKSISSKFLYKQNTEWKQNRINKFFVNPHYKDINDRRKSYGMITEMNCDPIASMRKVKKQIKSSLKERKNATSLRDIQLNIKK